MDGTSLVALIAGLVVGLLVGLAGGVLSVRTRQQVDTAERDSELARARSELARAEAMTAQVRTEVAQVRAETAQARIETERARADAAEARTEAADARTQAADQDAAVAAVAAQLAQARTERDGAVRRAGEIAADREAMLNQFKVLSAETIERQSRQTDAVAEGRLRATELLMAPVRESLDRFNERLTGVEKERVAMATDLQANVRAVRDTGETLRRETAALATALRKPQIRGSWGETQLRRVAEIAGMVERCDFELQLTSRTDEGTLRPDMTVHLAEGKHVFVDSKVPLSAFLEAAEATDEAARATHLATFGRHVKTHVDQLSGKQYWKAAQTPEFVVLFLPSEAFFAAALEQVPDLYDYAASRDVVIATPTTLIGMLRAVAYGWRQAALAESAAEVFQLGRELHERLGRMGARFDKLGRAIRSSVTAYNETVATVEGTVLVQARRFRDLRVSEKELTSLTSVDDPVRQIAAPELVEDAVQVEPLVGRRRARSRAAAEEVPEADDLFRADPGIADLVREQTDWAVVPSEGQRRA